MSHAHINIVAQCIKLLYEVYGTKDPLVVARGRVHECLEMTFDFGLNLGVAMMQCDLMKKICNNLPDDLKETRRFNLAPDDLLKIDENDLEFCVSKKEQYRATAAKTLLLSQSSRPDLKLITGFHCARSKRPRVEDWRKLKHLMGRTWHVLFYH